MALVGKLGGHLGRTRDPPQVEIPGIAMKPSTQSSFKYCLMCFFVVFKANNVAVLPIENARIPDTLVRFQY